MTDIYGKATSNGQEVIFRDAAGNLRPAIIKNLQVPIYKADLEVQLSNETKFVEGAVYNQGPAEGCWTHKPAGEEQKTPLVAPPSDDASQGADPDPAAATPKKGKK